MVSITYIDPIGGDRVELHLGDLAALTKGSSIRSMALSDDFIELGLSDELNLRIQGRISVLLISTLNKGQLPPVKVQIVTDKEAPTAAVVERRIHSLRQLYAATFLLNAGRADEIAKALENNSSADLEEILSADERLFVSAASEGSFWLTLLTKTTTAFQSLSNIITFLYPEGRAAWLDKIRAKAELEKLAVEKTRTDVAFERANRYIDLVQTIGKIKDPWVRQKAEMVISSNLINLGREPLALSPPAHDVGKD